jgi:hypothetical protein
MPKHENQVPGDLNATAVIKTTESVDQLRAQLAVAHSQIAALKAVAPVPSLVVFEPETPHGKAAKALSPWAHVTSAELIAKIDAGEVPEPEVSVLCKDGWLCRRRAAA